MSFIKFSHMFRDLFSTRLSQFNPDTEKFVADGFPRMLTDEHKQKRMGAALSFFKHYHRDDEFLNHIVTGHEIGSCTAHQRVRGSL
jgi:hypothetical protein